MFSIVGGLVNEALGNPVGAVVSSVADAVGVSSSARPSRRRDRRDRDSEAKGDDPASEGYMDRILARLDAYPPAARVQRDASLDAVGPARLASRISRNRRDRDRQVVEFDAANSIRRNYGIATLPVSRVPYAGIGGARADDMHPPLPDEQFTDRAPNDETTDAQYWDNLMVIPDYVFYDFVKPFLGTQLNPNNTTNATSTAAEMAVLTVQSGSRDLCLYDSNVPTPRSVFRVSAARTTPQQVYRSYSALYDTPGSSLLWSNGGIAFASYYWHPSDPLPPANVWDLVTQSCSEQFDPFAPMSGPNNVPPLLIIDPNNTPYPDCQSDNLSDLPSVYVRYIHVDLHIVPPVQTTYNRSLSLIWAVVRMDEFPPWYEQLFPVLAGGGNYFEIGWGENQRFPPFHQVWHRFFDMDSPLVDNNLHAICPNLIEELVDSCKVVKFGVVPFSSPQNNDRKDQIVSFNVPVNRHCYFELPHRHARNLSGGGILYMVRKRPVTVPNYIFVSRFITYAHAGFSAADTPRVYVHSRVVHS